MVQSALAKDNRRRQRISEFAQTVTAALDGLGFTERQKLLRLLVEEVHVTGWDVEIRLRIPLDEQPQLSPVAASSPKGHSGRRPLSSQDRLRSLRGDRR